MLIIAILVVIIVLLIFYSNKLIKETKQLSSSEKLNKGTINLPSNEEICKEIQEMLGSSCEIELDDKAKSSAYIYYLNKIILSNTESSRKDYTRVMFIAHECVHSVQDKLTHKINFGLANLKNIYDIVLIGLIIFGKCSWELIIISFLIAFLSFYYRMILEADAVYRSVIVSRKYLQKKNLEKIADKYEEIVPQTIQGMYIPYLLKILVRVLLLVTLFILFT